MSPVSCDMLYACTVIAQLCFMCLYVFTVYMCLFDELCALHVSSVTLLAHSVQLQLLLLRMSECGLWSTATTEQWCSYGECKSASMWHVCVVCMHTYAHTHTHTHMHTFTHTNKGICAMMCPSWLTAPLL